MSKIKEIVMLMLESSTMDELYIMLREEEWSKGAKECIQEEINKRLFQMGDQLGNCPFCGGKAKVEICHPFMKTAAHVVCNDCHASTSIYVSGNTLAFTDHPSVYHSVDDCINKAVARWNMQKGACHE